MIKNGLYMNAFGDKFWYLDGKIHRTDGPAVEIVTGDKFWCLYNKMYSLRQWLELVQLSHEEKLELVLHYD